MKEITVRTYRPGEEEDIASLLRRCFDTFNKYGLTGEKWLEYAELNSGFKLDGAYVIEVDGRIVSHVQVVEKELRTGLGVAATAGIANVSTDPDYRGRGYATTLMRRVVDDYRGKGYPLSALFTGFASGPQRIYRRIGYTDVVLEERLVAPISDALEGVVEVEGLEVSEAEVKDVKSAAKLYEEEGRGYTGWPKRPESDWMEKLYNRTAYHSFFYTPRVKGDFVVVEEGGELLGYAVTTVPPMETEALWILEIVYRHGRPDVLQALYNYAVRRASRKGLKIVRAMVPSTPDYSRVFRKFCSQATGGVYMVSLLSLKKLLSIVVGEALPELEGEPVERVKLKLEVGGEEVCLEISGGEVKYCEEAEARLRIPTEVFNKLIFGQISVLDLLLSSTVKSEKPLRAVVNALSALVRIKPLHIWPVDHW